MDLEQNTRLSQSMLWSLQKAAYRQLGPKAWSAQQVPSYITSSPLIARAYAHITLGFIRDGLSPHAIMPIDTSEVLYLFDLGAGTGRFGFLYLHYLLNLLEDLKIPLRICYVMTEISTATLEFLESHEQLKSLKKRHVLDFCVFEHDQAEENLYLRHSNHILLPGSSRNPMILIANYFFDTLPHDLFRVQQHRLEEGRISLSCSPPHDFPLGSPDSPSPSIIPYLNVETHYTPLLPHDTPYQNQLVWRQILNDYASEYEKLPQVLFPLGALQVIQRFSKLSNNKYLLLAADQGFHHPSQFENAPSFFSKHGTFSIHVNYHAIASYFKKIEGSCLTSSNLEPRLVNIAALSQGHSHQFPEVGQAFKQQLEDFELTDYVRMVDAIAEMSDAAPLALIFALIKLGHYDPCDFNLFIPRLIKEASKLPPSIQSELLNLIDHVHQHFYPISSEGGAFVMNLGVLCYHMAFYKQALFYFQRALDIGYSDPIIFKNITAVRACIDD